MTATRLLHVGAGSLWGGIETMLVTMARFRDEAPHLEQAFAVAFEGRLAAALRAARAPVQVFGPARTSRPWTVVRARRALAALLRRERFHVAAVHGSWSHALFGAVIRASGARLVAWAHAPMRGDHWLERWAARTRPDAVIANSRFTAAAVADLFRPAPVEVIPPPVPPPARVERGERARLRAALGAGPEDAVLLCAARLEPLKGIHVLVEALGMLRDLPGWTAAIVGAPQRPAEAAYLSSLERIARAGGVAGRVAFLGERDDVPELFASADVYCQPNVEPESFGMTFVEALQAGLPVVTSPLGGALEIVDASCGRLVSPRPPDVAAVLRELVASGAAREQLGREGRERARRTWDARAQVRRAGAVLEAAGADRPGAT
jgi:glycosyltransferase involved in cell wall biosynthesis